MQWFYFFYFATKKNNKMHSNQNVLIIGFVFPEPNSSAAGSRMLQLISVFKEQGWSVTFASAAADSDFMFDVESLGVQKKNILLNDSSFDLFLTQLAPTVVLFDRFMTEEQFGWRVAEQCPEALRILDTEDLHCLRKARELAWKENRKFESADLISAVAKREVASILRCDISLIISEFEMEILQNIFKVDSALLYYLPFLLSPIENNIIKNWCPFEARKNFIFIGNFLHEPNLNAVLFLKESIFPAIKNLIPHAVLCIYGAYAPQKVLQLHDPKTNFFVMGRAENAEEIVKNARVVLAPLRFGAGIKGKLVEAMWCGTPSVTTTIGAEAMHLNGTWNGCIADDVTDFAIAAVNLYEQKTLWLAAQKNGITIFNHRYLKSTHMFDFIHHILKIKGNLKQHRYNNFTGAMLLFHHAMGTKYMSKWIEAKNNNG